MDIRPFYPINSILQKHIEYYYFLRTDTDGFSSTYYAFPNVLQSFNIHKHAICRINGYATYVQGNTKDKPLMIIQGQHELPLFVQLKGDLDKITILFKPLGLNHFIENPLQKIAREPSQVFTEWYNREDCQIFLDAFFHTPDNSKRISLLEQYLLSLYRPFKEEAALQPAIDLLMDFSTAYSVEEIAQKVGLHSRSFNRLFVKHLGIPPVGFRKIARFRHSLKNRIFHERFQTLTHIAYESNYYDQSYFNKMYKKLTGQNPLKFFNSIDKLADDHLVFRFVNK